MPFDLAHLMPQISALASYYADELAPERFTCTERAQALLRQATQESLGRAAQQNAQRVLAAPLEEPAQAFPAVPAPPAYRVLASDGSAIAPDPHFPARYALFHTALAGLAYTPPGYWTSQRARLLYRDEELEIAAPGAGQPISLEGPAIDTVRADEELQALWAGVQEALADPAGRPLLAMTDAIILWTHRGSGPGQEAFRDEYLARGLAVLDEFRRAGIPLVSFTSMPHHREVVSTMLTQHCPDPERMLCRDCPHPSEPCTILRGLVDRDLFAFLPPGTRSALFQSIYQGETRWRYPREVWALDPRLAFCYLNAGTTEVARLEFPLWIVQAGLLDQLHSIVLDQCRPQRAETPGYPLALTLAHQEAVLTTRDRQAVQLMVEEALARRGVYAAPSAKAQAKGR